MTTEQTDHNKIVPQHVAVVMDGNGRWAKNRFLPRTAGHKAGVKATRRIVELCVKKGIGVLTLFAFSSENWNRPDQEVSSLMSLFLSTLNSELNKLHEQGVRIRFIGDRSRFHRPCRKASRLLKRKKSHIRSKVYHVLQAPMQMLSR